MIQTLDEYRRSSEKFSVKPLETLSFGKFGGFSKYKVQKTSPSLI